MKRAFVLVLSLLLVEMTMCADALAIQPGPALTSNSAIRLSTAMQKLGTGTDALVAIRLADKSIVKGHIAQAGAASFVVVDPDTAQRHIVRYTDIDRLQAYNLVTGAEVHHGTGVRAKLSRAVLKVVRPMPVNHLSGRDKTLLIGIIIGIILAIILGKVL